MVQTFLAIDPGPAVASLKLPKSWTWPRRLLWSGASATTQSVVVKNSLAFYHPGTWRTSPHKEIRMAPRQMKMPVKGDTDKEAEEVFPNASCRRADDIYCK
jgi:hypothetical protein